VVRGRGVGGGPPPPPLSVPPLPARPRAALSPGARPPPPGPGPAASASPPPRAAARGGGPGPRGPARGRGPRPAWRGARARARGAERVLVAARLEDLGDLVEREAELLVGREVVRPETDAGVRPEVAEDPALRQLRVDGLEVRHVHDDRAAAPVGLARRTHL